MHSRTKSGFSIRGRLIVFAVMSALVALAMGAIGYSAVHLLTLAMDDALVGGTALQNHTQADLKMDSLRADVLRGMRASTDAERNAVRDAVKEDVDELRNRIKANTELPLQPKIQASLAKVVPLIQPFIAAAQRENDLALRDPAAASAHYHDFIGGFTTLEENMDATRDLIRASVDSQEAASARTANIANATLLGVLVLGLLTIAVYAPLMVRAITRPLSAMTEAMTHLASGDASIEVPFVERNDEVGAMAAAVQVFKDNALDRLRLEEEATANRLAAEAEGRLTLEERARRAAEQTDAVRRLGEGLKAVAAGDLTTHLGEGISATYAQMQSDFNAAIDSLRETMLALVGCARSIETGTQEIASASGDLSRRTEQQAASLEETAAALDQITATVKKSAGGAGQARQVVADANDNAEKSSVVVREAVQAMDEIAGSSRRISQIIGVIDEIAFQTNLLALNAGVEAARAGEAGRGFAVVASEVRALAQRSGEAAREIKGLINSSTAQVDQGVRLVSATGQALEQIMGQVKELNTIVGEIAVGTREQATALEQVNIAINQMDQTTQQNAAMVEQSTAACQSLAGEAQELAQLVGRFKVSDVARPAARIEPRKAAPSAGLSGTRPAARAAGPVPALKVTGRGGAARKMDPAPAEQGWEEF